MKIKLDENVPVSVIRIFGDSGIDDVETVYSQKIMGISDSQLAKVCKEESRILITLDHDFLNQILFPLEEMYGVVILRSATQGKKAVIELIESFLLQMELTDVIGHMVIVEMEKIIIR